MSISVGGHSTLLFGVGLVALVASCLQIVAYTKAAQELGKLASSKGGRLDWVYGSSISPVVVVNLSIVVSSMTLVITSTFTGLDLVGMIVLRSRMWRHFSTRNAKRYMASACSPAWWPPLAPNASSGQWPADGKGYEYDMTIAWWQRWVFLEELVFAIQRNLAFIRLAAAMLLAMLWAPTVVQLVIVSMAGRCHTVAKSTIADEEALEACDLMRKGTIGAIATWACWTVLAALLVSFNTNPCFSPPQLSSLPFVRFSVPDVGCDPSGYRTSISLPLGQKQQQHPYMVKGGVMPPVQQVLGQMAQQPPQFGGYQAYQHKKQQPHGPTSGGVGQKKLPSSSYRSSWSYMDKGSITTDSCKGDSQSNKANPPLHPQNMVHQFYHLQNQQFQSLHQIQQASRMSEEKLHLRQQQQLASHKAVQRQLSLTLQGKSMYSSICTTSEQSLDTESVPATKTEPGSIRQEGGSSSLQLQRQHLQMLQQQGQHEGGGARPHRPVRGASVSGEQISQLSGSFARHHLGSGSEEADSDKASKRNTIG
ncbi:hypothetical protein GGI20_003980 [Coemansia sp. BCRC 34301]|nr:hypothetical protein GGI20_003980 [Coemansia sp. BCRC 34301]